MDYELAKVLKNAGFPQERRGGYACMPAQEGAEFVYVPTLCELVEACGDNFGMLVRANEKDWYADSEHGSTPDEAVARLWLALSVSRPSESRSRE